MALLWPWMKTGMEALVAALFIAVLTGVAFGQGKADEPTRTTVCEIVNSPVSFNGKIITVRVPIEIAFEDFGLSVSECGEKRIGLCARIRKPGEMTGTARL